VNSRSVKLAILAQTFTFLRRAEKAGELLDNTEMAAEGRDESLSGSIQKKIGEIKKVFGK
jgi:hypothetical protein